MKTQVQMSDGLWEVRLDGDHLMIVDAEGRCRHESQGHVMTGVHLAMRLAEMEFASVPNLDEALRMRAQEFTATAPHEKR